MNNDAGSVEGVLNRRSRVATSAARSMTFKDCAKLYIEDHKAGWRNAKHATQWANTLETYTYPVFGSLPVQSVDMALVKKALGPDLEQKTGNCVPGSTADRSGARLG